MHAWTAFPFLILLHTLRVIIINGWMGKQFTMHLSAQWLGN